MYQIEVDASTELYETVSFSWAAELELAPKSARSTKEKITRRIFVMIIGPPLALAS